MGYDIRKPQISAPTEQGQLFQIKSYLLQLVEQLNYAFHALEGSGGASGTEEEPTLKLTPGLFSEIKSLIMKSSDIIKEYYAKMEPMIDEKFTEKFTEGIGAHNTDPNSHTDIRELIEALKTKVEELAGEDDEVLEQINEIVKDIETINTTIDEMQKALEGKLDATALDSAIEEALAQAKASGEFDGADGKDGTSVTVQSVSESTADGGSNVVTFSDGKSVTIKNGSKGSTGATGATGPQGPKGDTGAAGYTPVKGTDYFTAVDKAEMVSMVLASLPTWSGGSY